MLHLETVVALNMSFYQPQHWGSRHGSRPNGLFPHKRPSRDREVRLSSNAQKSGSILSGPDGRSVTLKQLTANFIEPYLTRLNRDGFYSWLAYVPDLLVHSSELHSIHHSILSLCLADLGWSRDDTAVLSIARTQYGNALQRLQHNISNDVLPPSDATLCSCVALSMAGYCFGETLDPHYSGMAAMVQLRGPETFKTGVARHLFTFIQISLSGEALLRRSQVFLSSHEWRQISDPGLSSCSELNVPGCLTDNGEQHLDLQRFDRVAVLADLRFRLKMLSTADQLLDATIQGWISLIRHTWDLLDCHIALLSRFDGKVVSMAPTTFIQVEGSNPYPLSYQFDCVSSAKWAAGLWANISIIYHMLQSAFEALENLEPAAYKHHEDSLDPVLPCSRYSLPPQAGLASLHTGSQFCLGSSIFLERAGTALSSTTFANSLASLAMSPSLSVRCQQFALTFAHRVCMTIQHCFHDGGGFLASTTVYFPLLCSCSIFSSNLPTAKGQQSWAMAVFARLRARKSSNTYCNGTPDEGHKYYLPRTTINSNDKTTITTIPRRNDTDMLAAATSTPQAGAPQDDLRVSSSHDYAPFDDDTELPQTVPSHVDRGPQPQQLALASDSCVRHHPACNQYSLPSVPSFLPYSHTGQARIAPDVVSQPDQAAMVVQSNESLLSMANTTRPPAVTSTYLMRCWDHGCNGRTFSHKGNYTRHLMEHAGSSRVLCPECGRTFTREANCRQHLAKQTCRGAREGLDARL